MASEKYSVYRYTHPTNEEVLYIGITNNPTRRHWEHNNRAKGVLYKVLKDLRDQGTEALYEIVESDCDLQTARALEKQYIKTDKPLHNFVSNDEAREERRLEENRKLRLRNFMEYHNLTAEEAEAHYWMVYELYGYGGIEPGTKDTPYLMSVVTDAVRGMEKLFHIKQPLTYLELIRFTYHVTGLSKNLDVQRPEIANDKSAK